MVDKKSCCLRQIRVPLALYQAVKHHCIKAGITLNIFYKEVFAWYLQQENTIYFASYKKGRIMSIWIDDNQLKDLRVLAQAANVSDARVVFTALILYCQNYKIYESIEESSTLIMN